MVVKRSENHPGSHQLLSQMAMAPVADTLIHQILYLHGMLDSSMLVITNKFLMHQSTVPNPGLQEFPHSWFFCACHWTASSDGRQRAPRSVDRNLLNLTNLDCVNFCDAPSRPNGPSMMGYVKCPI